VTALNQSRRMTPEEVDKLVRENEAIGAFAQRELRAEAERDRQRDVRRQRILDHLTQIVRGGGAWTLDELMHDLSNEDRVFMAQVFPMFIEKLRGAYPDQGMGRLADINGVRHIMDLVKAERERPYAEVLAERHPSDGNVKVEVMGRAGDFDRVELELELMALGKMKGIRRIFWTAVLLMARTSETMLRRVRSRLARKARA